MEYNFQDIEPKWRKIWADNKTFKAEDNSSKPKYYDIKYIRHLGLSCKFML